MTLFRLFAARLVLAWAALFVSGVVAVAATHHVEILDDEFEPKNLTVAPGDAVVWTNVGGSAHTVTADNGLFDSSTSGSSSSIPAGGTFTYTFTEAGRNPYYCLLHGGPGGLDMSGVIRVLDPSESLPPATPTNLTPASNAGNVSVGPTLTASAFSDPDQGDQHDASQWIIRSIGTGEVALDTGAVTNSKTSIILADLAFSTTYGWSVRYRDDRQTWSAYSAETQFTTVAAPTGAGSGLTASYALYNARTNVFTVRVTEVDPEVNFDWKLGRAQRVLPVDNFFVRWEGKVTPEFSERYRFRLRADGGVRLWINGQLLIDDWVSNTRFPVFRNNVINLEAGVPVTIKLEYFDLKARASIDLRWSSPSQPTQIIPTARLFPLTQP